MGGRTDTHRRGPSILCVTAAAVVTFAAGPTTANAVPSTAVTVVDPSASVDPVLTGAQPDPAAVDQLLPRPVAQPLLDGTAAVTASLESATGEAIDPTTDALRPPLPLPLPGGATGPADGPATAAAGPAVSPTPQGSPPVGRAAVNYGDGPSDMARKAAPRLAPVAAAGSRAAPTTDVPGRRFGDEPAPSSSSSFAHQPALPEPSGPPSAAVPAPSTTFDRDERDLAPTSDRAEAVPASGAAATAAHHSSPAAEPAFLGIDTGDAPARAPPIRDVPTPPG